MGFKAKKMNEVILISEDFHIYQVSSHILVKCLRTWWFIIQAIF